MNPYILPPVSHFGDTIRAAMARLGITSQDELAALVKRPKGQISGWLNRKNPNPQLRSLFALAKVLRLPIDVLVAGLDPEYDAMRQQDQSPERTAELWRRASAREPEASRQLWRMLLVFAGEPIVRADDPTPQPPPTLPPDPRTTAV